jgi:VanZ family protein
MSVVVSISSASEALGWRHALVVLACERAAPMLAALGVPEPIARAPQPMIDAAQEFWRLDQALASAAAAERAHTGPDQRRLATVAQLNAALSALGNAYRGVDLGELVAWATRHYVDEQQRADLFLWSQLLLSAVLRDAATSLPPGQQASFVEAMAGRVGAAAETADKQRVKAFESAAPSPFETRLEQEQPELYSLALESLRETLRNQRTWQALAVLATRIDDRDGFLGWARDQAAFPGIPPGELHWR